ncbi:MAG: cupin domain-containing protein [Myxococcales bacterium]|nr:cupin domain-containing protein [Myxococcales bacterium]
MSTDPRRRLDEFPVHLGLGATVVPLARFTGTADWYERYGAGCVADGAEGRLVTMHTFSEPWAVWEVHPHGEELVVCTAGELTLHQEVDGAVQTVVLTAGEAAINPRGVWHTADVAGAATALFITAGLGTAHRPR